MSSHLLLSSSWPNQQAFNVLKHIAKSRLSGPEVGQAFKMIGRGEVAALFDEFPQLADSPVIFETGYGPSGAPHIGTFAEVVRTSWVRHAFDEIVQRRVPSRLIAFSDDYDGFRRVPDGLPQWMEDDLNLPLTAVRDPDGVYSSFGEANNVRLRAFLSELGIDYEFRSSTEAYRGGAFNDTLDKVFDNYDAIQAIMLPTLGAERQATYSAFMPISPVSGHVLQTGVTGIVPEERLLGFKDEEGTQHWTSIHNGAVKLQWKIDWAMRWAAFDIAYEMSGKDLIDSVTVANKVVRLLGAQPPVQMTYEMFLDERGEKISKSKGNGLSVSEWLKYGSRESLSYYMFGNPTAAKKLHRGVIPRAQDDYLADLVGYEDEMSWSARPNHPVWHIHDGNPPSPLETDVTMSLLLNMAAVSRAQDPSTLWRYLEQNRPVSAADRPRVQQMIVNAINYSVDEVYPHATFRNATKEEKVAFIYLAEALEALGEGKTAEEYQAVVYEVGKQNGYADDLRAWFRAIYETIFGAEDGPRIGAFVLAYGLKEVCDLLLAVPYREPFEPESQREKLAWVKARQAYGENCPSPHEGMPPSVWCSFLAEADEELSHV